MKMRVRQVSALVIGVTVIAMLVLATPLNEREGPTAREESGPLWTTPTATPLAFETATLFDGILTAKGIRNSMAGGSEHACAMTAGGGVKCWGGNEHGQLGGAPVLFSATPVDVQGLEGKVVAVSAGSYHTCALTASGGVKCWGENEFGQLGDGSKITRATPVGVVGLSSGVAAIAAGRQHACALTVGGGVRCWGNNRSGQLGDGKGSGLYSLTPVDVVGLGREVARITAGGAQSCALTVGGAAQCWGLIGLTGMGVGSAIELATPADVSGLHGGVAAIAAGSVHTCALTVAGAVKCWGRNDDGQLGGGSWSYSLTPVNVVGLGNGVAAIAAGGEHTCALTIAGALKCWGRYYSGQPYAGTPGLVEPVDVPWAQSGVTAFAASGYYDCAVISGGKVKCWKVLPLPPGSPTAIPTATVRPEGPFPTAPAGTPFIPRFFTPVTTPLPFEKPTPLAKVS